ncbi:MAG: hypothetical protein OCD76_13275 [Reichenbachiella sp.]
MGLFLFLLVKSYSYDTRWVESPDYCENIMGDRATHIGVAKSADGFYWTMVFGRE